MHLPRADRWPAGSRPIAALSGLLAVLLAVLVVSLPGAGGEAGSPHLVAAVSGGRCPGPDPSNPVFSHTQGNRLIDTSGQVMVPNGMTFFGLAMQDWQADSVQQDRQIVASITQWCTNYVRIQVAPADLLSQSPYDHAYLRAVEGEVQLALGYDENVVLSAQTERYSAGLPEKNPTEQTVRFWQLLAPVYARNPRVWFDLFNEPRLKVAGNPWVLWQQGGVVAGQRYVGMQQLVDSVRAEAAHNLILVEGPHFAQTLEGLPGHEITGANVAYAVHPYGQHSPAVWNTTFGTAAQTHPVIIDEWGEWSAGACSPSAATYVPEFFAYLRQRQIGLGAWALVPGVLVTNTTDFTPTRITASYTCSPPPSERRIVIENERDNGSLPVPGAEGAGQLIQDYFTAYART
jgi:hypothetical protein